MANVAPARIPSRVPFDLERGSYLQSEAARFAGVPRATVRRWLRLQPGRTEAAGAADQLPVSFLDLIGLRAIAGFRELGLRLDQVQQGVQRMREALDAEYPLALEDLRLDGVDRYFCHVSTRPKVQAGDRPGAQDLISRYLSDVVYQPVGGDRRLATAWKPPGVSLDPRIQFGAPCVAGTRVQIAILKKYADAGDPPDLLAQLYELDLATVRAALHWYEGLSKRAA